MKHAGANNRLSWSYYNFSHHHDHDNKSQKIHIIRHTHIPLVPLPCDILGELQWLSSSIASIFLSLSCIPCKRRFSEVEWCGTAYNGGSSFILKDDVDSLELYVGGPWSAASFLSVSHGSIGVDVHWWEGSWACLGYADFWWIGNLQISNVLIGWIHTLIK